MHADADEARRRSAQGTSSSYGAGQPRKAQNSHAAERRRKAAHAAVANSGARSRDRMLPPPLPPLPSEDELDEAMSGVEEETATGQYGCH